MNKFIIPSVGVLILVVVTAFGFMFRYHSVVLNLQSGTRSVDIIFSCDRFTGDCEREFPSKK